MERHLITCSKCEVAQEPGLYYRHSNGKPRKQCKLCMQQTNRKNYNKEQATIRAKKYRETHRELCLDRSRQWRKNNLAYDAFRRKLYQQRRAKQTPLWADIDTIKQIYLDRPDGHHVDHIIPLHGKTVCGLHVENNLQYLTQHENCKKGNRYG